MTQANRLRLSLAAVDRAVAAHDDGKVLAQMLSFGRQRVADKVLITRPLLPFDPVGEILRGLRIDAQQHLRVLSSTILRTLSQIEP